MYDHQDVKQSPSTLVVNAALAVSLCNGNCESVGLTLSIVL